MRTNPSEFEGDDRPVEQVSWDKAVEFCDRLSKRTGREYRLPSESEWEYACRAGTTTPFHFGETILPELANYRTEVKYDGKIKDDDLSTGQSRGETIAVGSFPPNVFGLYNMHGNVWEWCLDHWQKNYEGAPADGSAWLDKKTNSNRLLRGGSWYSVPADCRSAIRLNFSPGNRYDNFGFRVVCSSARTL
jgi:formylglycine-generating enzyme required for sulfatase activity